MSARYEYTVSRNDVFHVVSDRGGCGQKITELGVCATLKEANKLAKSNANEQQQNGFEVGRKSVGYTSENEVRISCFSLKAIQEQELDQGERYYFRIDVCAKPLPRSDTPETLEQNGIDDDGMVRIPSGKLGGLKGARFLFAGNLKSMTREVAQAAVYAYGGEVVTEPGSKTARISTPFSNGRELDFVVTGKDGVQPKELEYAALFGKSNLDEMGFFKLLRIGALGFLDSLFNEHESSAHDDSSSDEDRTFYTWTYGDKPSDDGRPVRPVEDEDESETENEDRPAKRPRH